MHLTNQASGVARGRPRERKRGCLLTLWPMCAYQFAARIHPTHLSSSLACVLGRESATGAESSDSDRKIESFRAESTLQRLQDPALLASDPADRLM